MVCLRKAILFSTVEERLFSSIWSFLKRKIASLVAVTCWSVSTLCEGSVSRLGFCILSSFSVSAVQQRRRESLPVVAHRIMFSVRSRMKRYSASMIRRCIKSSGPLSNTIKEFDRSSRVALPDPSDFGVSVNSLSHSYLPQSSKGSGTMIGEADIREDIPNQRSGRQRLQCECYIVPSWEALSSWSSKQVQRVHLRLTPNAVKLKDIVDDTWPSKRKWLIGGQKAERMVY